MYTTDQLAKEEELARRAEVEAERAIKEQVEFFWNWVAAVIGAVIAVAIVILLF